MHLRRANDKAHMEWKCKHMSTEFAKRPRTTVAQDTLSAAVIAKQLRQMYSADMLRDIMQQAVAH